MGYQEGLKAADTKLLLFNWENLTTYRYSILVFNNSICFLENKSDA